MVEDPDSRLIRDTKRNPLCFSCPIVRMLSDDCTTREFLPAFLLCFDAIDLKQSITYRVWKSLFNEQISFDGTYWNADLGNASEEEMCSFWVVCTNFCIEVLVGFDEIKEITAEEAKHFWESEKVQDREGP